MKKMLLILCAQLGLMGVAGSQGLIPTPEVQKMVFEKELDRYKMLESSGQEAVASEGRIDVKYYRLDLAISASPASIRGVLTMNATSVVDGLAAIRLDKGSPLTIDSVNVNDVRTAFTPGSGWVDVSLDHTHNAGDPMTVVVYYHGSIAGRLKLSYHSGVPWICSQSCPWGARDWWPCKDHPGDKADSIDIYATVDSTLKVASNGQLLAVINNGDGTSTTHWHHRYPIATYLVFVAITNYSEFTNWYKYSPTDSMPVLNYVLPESLVSAQTNIPRTVGMLEIYSDLMGQYPFIAEKFGHNQYNWDGVVAMEHQTMTSTVNFDEWALAHELAHQWFGDMITMKTWPHIWVNEGFAHYMMFVYYERKYGLSSFRSWVTEAMDLSKLAAGPVFRADSSDIWNYNRTYEKGATILHMLRHVLGDSVFFLVMKTYAQDSAFKYGNSTTEGFRSVCEAVSGKGLGYFFDEWVYGENYPRYGYLWNVEPSGPGYRVDLTLLQSTQTPNPGFFTMPIDCRVIGADWDTTVVLFNDSLRQSYAIDVAHQPTSIALDPHDWILNRAKGGKSGSFGPVIVDSINIARTSPEMLKIWLWLRNQGADSTLSNVRVELHTADTVVYSFIQNNISLGSLAPGRRSASSAVFFIRIDSSLKAADIPFVANVSTDDVVCWMPEFTVKLRVAPLLSRNSINFGDLRGVGTRTDSMTLRNPTAQPMIVDTAVTDSASTFSITPSNAVLPPFDSLKFTVTFHPAVYGVYRGHVTIIPRAIYSPAIVDLQGSCGPPAVDVAVDKRWNLLSVPMELTDYRTNAIFPGSTSPAYHYAGTYHTHSTLTPGEGYWLKFGSPEEFEIPGTIIDEDTIPVRKGWNLIGSITLPVAVSSIGSLPGGILTTGFYGYAGSDDYFLADTIRPGCGYWVKTNSEGGLVLSLTGNILPGNRIRVTATDDLPPLPPEGGAEGAERVLPIEYHLDQNYPNPFNPSTTISYALPEKSDVRLVVFNLLGEEVAMLVNGEQDAGFWTVTFGAGTKPGVSLPSGIYLCRLMATSVTDPGRAFIRTQKMVLLK